MFDTSKLKVAIVHDWLVNFGGAERVVLAILDLFPQAQIYTLVYDKKKMNQYFSNVKIHTSFVQKIPFATKLYTKMLSFMPRAFEAFNLTDFDIVISSSSSCAKGVITRPDSLHIAYIHTPMRYAWDLYYDYKKSSGFLTRFFMNLWMPNLRLWDYVSSQRIDCIVANSHYIAQRIKKFWNRQAKVVFPPVNTSIRLENVDKEDYYVAFSRLVAYKRVDLAICACKKLGKRLLILGAGPQEKKLKILAKGATNSIEFLGRLSDKDTYKYMSKAKALLFCAKEDFGIIPVEAQSCMCPVIAYGVGGVCESVIDGKTGLFFQEQTVESLQEAIIKFEEMQGHNPFNLEAIKQNAMRFDTNEFKKHFLQILEQAYNDKISH